jgi:hypothetical protein
VELRREMTFFLLLWLCNIHKINSEIRSNREKYKIMLALPQYLGYNINTSFLFDPLAFHQKYSTTAGG